MFRVAVVILNWNGKSLLKEFLPSVIRHTNLTDTKVFVADNGSTDDSIDYLKKDFPDTEIIALDKNYGFAEGYNRALAQIDAQYFVLLNSDIEVTEGWIEPIIELMDRDKSIAAFMPKIMSYNNRQEFEYAGAAGGFIDRFGFPFCRGRIFNVFEKDEGQYDTVSEIFWATGACMFIRADLFNCTGGLDKHFFAHMEEIDLCWRLKNMGYRIMYHPGVKVYHLGGGTLKKINPHKTYLNFRNNLFLLYKNLPPYYFYRTFIGRFILDWIAAVKFLAGLEFKNSLAVCRAHISFISMVHSFRPKRKTHLPEYIKYDHPEVYLKSIVVDFFLRGKKYFRDLEF